MAFGQQSFHQFSTLLLIGIIWEVLKKNCFLVPTPRDPHLIGLECGFSTLALLTFGARSYFALRGCRHIVGYLAVSWPVPLDVRSTFVVVLMTRNVSRYCLMFSQGQRRLWLRITNVGFSLGIGWLLNSPGDSNVQSRLSSTDLSSATFHT